MTSQLITEISVTPIPVFYRKELGKNAYGDNIGTSRLEWLVRARTDGGLEGLTIANRYMRPFVDFYKPEGTLAGLVQLLRESRHRSEAVGLRRSRRPRLDEHPRLRPHSQGTGHFVR